MHVIYHSLYGAKGNDGCLLNRERFMNVFTPWVLWNQGGLESQYAWRLFSVFSDFIIVVAVVFQKPEEAEWNRWKIQYHFTFYVGIHQLSSHFFLTRWKLITGKLELKYKYIHKKPVELPAAKVDFARARWMWVAVEILCWYELITQNAVATMSPTGKVT